MDSSGSHQGNFGRERLHRDEDGFAAAMKEQKEKARKARKTTNYMGADVTVYQSIDPSVTTEFIGYDRLTADSRVTVLTTEEELVQALTDGQKGTIIVEQTPFYGTMGGQQGDTGVISNENGAFKVEDTIHLQGGKVGHVGVMTKGMFQVGENVTLSVCAHNRALTCKNHSATHLLQKALRKVLGDHVEQAGSYVDAGRLRFDFTHFSAMTPDEIKKVEELVNHALHVAQYQERPGRTDFCDKNDHNGAVHRCLHGIMHLVEDHAKAAEIPLRFAASKLVEGASLVLESLHLSQNEKEMLEHIICQMEAERGLDRAAAIADMRFSFIGRVCEQTVVKPTESREHARSTRIDKLLTGPFTAIPAFVAIMALVFWLTFNVVGAWLSELLDGGITALTDVVASGLAAAHVNEVLQSLIIDGVFNGVGSVLSFLLPSSRCSSSCRCWRIPATWRAWRSSWTSCCGASGCRGAASCPCSWASAARCRRSWPAARCRPSATAR